jgi:hypothetical protein
MAVNPNIALSVQGLQLADPLAQFAKATSIQGAQQQNQLAQMQMRQLQQEREQTNMLNEAYSKSVDPTSGQVDVNKLRQNLATMGMGAQIPKVEEQFFKGQQARATFQKTKGEVLDSALKRSRQFLENLDPNAPDAAQQYLAWHQANHSDPVIGPALQARGVTLESVQQQLNDTLNQPDGLQKAIMQSMLGVDKFMEMNKPQLSTVNLGGSVQTRTFQPLTGELTTLQDQGMVPQPAAVEAQKSRIAKAGATTVNVSTERAYGGEVAKLAAQQDIELANQASTMVRNANKIDEALDLLYNADINTGIGAEMFTVLDKARAKFAADKAAGRRVEGTEYLDALLGSDVFPQISALGIGARGLDTPAEREFLRSVITGSIKMDRDTLIRMTEFRRRALEDSAKVYNEKVESGALDKYFEYTGRPKAKIEIPKAPTRTQAPMYATNPQTGARIVSTDGGNTWRPVGQ